MMAEQMCKWLPQVTCTLHGMYYSIALWTECCESGSKTYTSILFASITLMEWLAPARHRCDTAGSANATSSVLKT